MSEKHICESAYADGKRMKVAYIAGRYRAKTEYELEMNIRLAEEWAIQYARRGYAVICPHKNTGHLGGVMDDSYFLEATLELMRRADLVVMIPGWTLSAGAIGERAEALRLGIPIVYEGEGPQEQVSEVIQ